MAENSFYIEAYKNDNTIIADYYKFKDKYNNEIILNDIINPLTIDNRHLISPIDSQRGTSACSAYSAATIIESIYWKRTGILKQFNSHQVYAKAKEIDNNRDELGTYLEYAFKSVLTLCENNKDYDFLKSGKLYAQFNKRDQYTIEVLKHFIHRDDFIQAGFVIDEGWTSCTNENYIITTKGRSLGGHAVVLCGYNSDGFIVCNSWGTTWGAKGFAIIPYDLLLKTLQYCIGFTFA